jgi:hypothetical protein
MRPVAGRAKTLPAFACFGASSVGQRNRLLPMMLVVSTNRTQPAPDPGPLAMALLRNKNFAILKSCFTATYPPLK